MLWLQQLRRYHLHGGGKERRESIKIRKMINTRKRLTRRIRKRRKKEMTKPRLVTIKIIFIT